MAAMNGNPTGEPLAGRRPGPFHHMLRNGPGLSHQLPRDVYHALQHKFEPGIGLKAIILGHRFRSFRALR